MFPNTLQGRQHAISEAQLTVNFLFMFVAYTRTGVVSNQAVRSLAPTWGCMTTSHPTNRLFPSLRHQRPTRSGFIVPVNVDAGR